MSRCIVADDSKTMRLLLMKIMENFGYMVEEAEDGEDLLEQCTRDMPDLIISDWTLPLIDGIDVLYKIRSNPRAPQPVFLFCSHIKDPEIISQALKGGADDFIMRPFDEEIIAMKLKIIKFMKGVKHK